jgi:hypothetical protein
MAMLLDNDRGGGGALLTTAGDLLIWNDALTNRSLSSFVTDKLQEPAMLSNGRKLSYTRGIFADSVRGTQFWRHGGSADGYKSLLARFPEQGLSISIMCNSGDETDKVAYAMRIFNLFVPAANNEPNKNTAPPIATGSIDPTTLDLSSKAGVFFNETSGEPLRLAVDRGRLRVAAGPFLVAESNDRFTRWGANLEFMSGDKFELQFSSQNQFELKSMEGKITRYRRARLFSPKADELKAFAGRFGSDEIKTAFLIEPNGEGLVLRLEHSPTNSLEFKPVDTDTFQWGRMMLRFQRDKGGKVVALEYSNPLLSKIKFTRLSVQK